VSGLDAIGVRVEGPDLKALARENAWPILHEIRHALARLLESGEETVIDLRGLPLSDLDQDYLVAELGTGELECRLDALGRSVIQETAYHGVWLVTHYNAGERVIGRFVEVTHIPAILKSDPIDIRSDLDRLTERLAAGPEGAPAGEADSQ
jgi:hydrogenase-1 operon protein HyaF